MKQLLQPERDGAFVAATRRRPAPAVYACAPHAAWMSSSFDVTGPLSAMGIALAGFEGHVDLGANGRTAIPNDARRRPPETPT
jgi:hypothetical protein